MWPAEVKLRSLCNECYRSASNKPLLTSTSKYTNNYKQLVRDICLTNRQGKSVFVQALTFMKKHFYDSVNDALINENAIFVETSPWYFTDEKSTDGVARIMLHALPPIKDEFKTARRTSQITDKEDVFIRRLKFHSFTGYPSFFRMSVVGGTVDDKENESQAIGMCSCGMSGFMENQPMDPLHGAVDEGHIVALKQSIDKIRGTKNAIPYEFKKKYSMYGIPDDEQHTKFTSVSEVHASFQKFLDSLISKMKDMQTSDHYAVELEECRRLKKIILDNHCSKVYIPTKNASLQWEKVHQMLYETEEEDVVHPKYTRNEKEAAEGEILAQVVAFGGHIRLFHILELFLLRGERALRTEEESALAGTLVQKAKLSEDAESIKIGMYSKKTGKKKKKRQASSSSSSQEQHHQAANDDSAQSGDEQKADDISESLEFSKETENPKLDEQEAKLQKEHDALQKFQKGSKWIVYGDPTDEIFSKYFTESPRSTSISLENPQGKNDFMLSTHADAKPSHLQHVGVLYPLPLIVTIEEFIHKWKRYNSVNVTRSLSISYYLKDTDEAPVEKVYTDVKFFNYILNGNFFYSFDEMQLILKKEAYRRPSQTVFLKNDIRLNYGKWLNHTLPKDAELFVLAINMGDFATLDADTFFQQKVCKHIPTIATRSAMHFDVYHLHHFQIKAEKQSEVENQYTASYNKLKKQYPKESLVHIKSIPPESTDLTERRLDMIRWFFESENGAVLQNDKLPNVVARIESIDEATHSIRLVLVGTDYTMDVEKYAYNSNVLELQVLEPLTAFEKQQLKQFVEVRHNKYAPMEKETEVAVQDEDTNHIHKVKLHGYYKLRGTTQRFESFESVNQIPIIVGDLEYKQFQEWMTLGCITEIASDADIQRLARNYKHRDKFWDMIDPPVLGMVHGSPFWRIREDMYPTLSVHYHKLRKGKLTTIVNGVKSVTYNASDGMDPALGTQMLDQILRAVREASTILTNEKDEVVSAERLDAGVESMGVLLSHFFSEAKEVITQRVSSVNFFPLVLNSINSYFYFKGRKHTHFWNKHGVELMKMLSKLFSTCDVSTASDVPAFMNWNILMHYMDNVIHSFLSDLTDLWKYHVKLTKTQDYTSNHVFNIIGAFVGRSPNDKIAIQTQNVYLLFVNAINLLNQNTKGLGDTTFDIYEEAPSFTSYEKSIFFRHSQELSRQVEGHEYLRKILDRRVGDVWYLTNVSNIQTLCFLQDHLEESQDRTFSNHLQIMSILRFYYEKRGKILRLISKMHRTLIERQQKGDVHTGPKLPVGDCFKVLLHEVKFHAQFRLASVNFMYTAIPLQFVCKIMKTNPNDTIEVLREERYRTWCQKGLELVKQYIPGDSQPSPSTINNRLKIQESVHIIERFLKENLDGTQS